MERRRFVKTQFGTMEWILPPPPPPLTELQKIALATRYITNRYRDHIHLDGGH